MDTKLNDHDLEILRRLAGKKMRYATDTVNLERQQAWYDLDGGGSHRPMVLAEFGGVRDAKCPIPLEIFECQDEWARGLEWGLRSEIWQFEVLKDDHVIAPYINTNWVVNASDYGVQRIEHRADGAIMGAYSWEPALKNLDEDFGKLKPRRFSVDRAASMALKERLERVFAGIMPVRVRGKYWWTLGMTINAINLIGLENLMLYMFDNPEGLHRLMNFLCEDNLAYARWLEAEGLLSLNNENDYIGSGSMGYTRDLPQKDLPSGGHVRMKDQWVLLESQETVGVGPELFAEFIFPYQKKIAEQFGKCYYGCCEPVDNRWHVLKNIANLARVSVSPWAKEEFMADACGNAVVYSRKPNPSQISMTGFDETAILADLRKTIRIAGKCRLEIIMKDVHTLNNEPQRISRWVELARQAIAGD
jgi:hypothetical protein